jgi:O-antigen ligase
MLAFVAAAFLLPSEPAYALIFYCTVLATLAARVWRGFRPDWRDPVILLALALIVWSGLTLLWGQDDGHRRFRFLGDTLATLCFVAGMAAVFPDHALRRRLGLVLIVAGGVNAVFSIGLNLITHPHDPRLHGWGATTHPILGAAVMAVAYLTALARGLAQPRHHWPALAAAFVMAWFILLTESRGPLLAAGIATVFLCAAGPWRLRAFAGLAAACAIWAALPVSVRQHSEKLLAARGSSHRFEIWTYTGHLIEGRPILGHGLAANLHLDVGDQITFPHNLYLSLLFYSGLIGFGLFAALAAVLSRRLILARADAEFPWLMALWLNLLVAGLTDMGQITKGPGPLWLIVWLPIGLIAGAYPTRWRPAPS